MSSSFSLPPLHSPSSSSYSLHACCLCLAFLHIVFFHAPSSAFFIFFHPPCMSPLFKLSPYCPLWGSLYVVYVFLTSCDPPSISSSCIPPPCPYRLPTCHHSAASFLPCHPIAATLHFIPLELPLMSSVMITLEPPSISSSYLLPWCHPFCLHRYHPLATTFHVILMHKPSMLSTYILSMSYCGSPPPWHLIASSLHIGPPLCHPLAATLHVTLLQPPSMSSCCSLPPYQLPSCCTLAAIFHLCSCSLPLCHPLAAAASLDIILCIICNLFPLQKFLAMVASKVWPSFSLKGIDVKLVWVFTSSVHISMYHNYVSVYLGTRGVYLLRVPFLNLHLAC